MGRFHRMHATKNHTHRSFVPFVFGLFDHALQGADARGALARIRF
jgi:hypothetical protein